jgi:hypothetical protein
MWAKKIRVVLQGRGMYDLTTKDITNRYLSPLLTKCPAYLTDIIPKDNLENAITFLEAWDDTSGTLADGFRDTTIDTKPSIQYYLNVQSFKTNMPPGVSAAEHMNIANALAWEALKRSMPPDFRVFVTLLNIKSKPSNEDLKKLNEGWRTYCSKNRVEGISAVQNQPSGVVEALASQAESYKTNNELMSAINNLNENVKSNTAVAFNTAKQLKNFANDTKRNFKQNQATQQTNKQSNRATSQTRRDAFPGRTDLCFYHRRFGKKAERCNTEECAWESRNGNGQNDLN